MISFIVIGRNEGWRLRRCLDSVVAAAGNFARSEVLYVDSQSTDGSVELALEYAMVRVFRITGPYNAAIARNIGAREARGDILFFVDGDMEILCESLNAVYDEEQGLLHDFVSGCWVDYNYPTDTERTPVEKEVKCPGARDGYTYRTGGLFLIARELWQAVGGMRNKLRRNQDFDLSVRLANQGVYLFRSKEILAIHHTTSPRQNLRKMLTRGLSGAWAYRVVSLRDNLLNRYQWSYFFRTSYTFFLLVATLIAAAFTNFPVLLVYVGAVIFRSIGRGQFNLSVFVPSVLLIIWNDLVLLASLFFFWPKDHRLSYEEVCAPTT